MKRDVSEECLKFGEIEKMTVFEKHDDGVIVVKFANAEVADACIQAMKGRFYGGRKIDCQLWDGTDYTHRESQQEELKRTEAFGQWLNEGSDDEDDEDHDDSAIPTEAHSGRVMPDAHDSGDDLSDNE